ncbi:MAG TPA: hypothetical protein VIC05_03695 [Solirubrobacteraceae bacterium]
MHDVADEQRVQRVDFVLAGDVVAAAGDLLGQDRAPQCQDADEVCDRAGGEEWQERSDVVCQLEREDDAGEGERITQG